MTDRLEIENIREEELKKVLSNINWPFDYGTVKIQIRKSKVQYIAIERTIRLD